MPSPAAPRFRAFEVGYLVLIALVLLPFVLTSATAADEFIPVNQSLRVAHGEAMYRDFFEFAPPLSRWALAGVFWLAGPSLLAARLFQAGCFLASSWLLFRLGRRFGLSRPLAALPGLLLVGALYPLLPIVSYHWFVVPLWLGALTLALLALERDRGWGWVGVLTGLVIGCVQSDGLTWALALALMLVLGPLMGRVPWRRALERLGLVAAGVAVVLLPVLAILAAQGALSPAYRDVWHWTMTTYAAPGNVNDVRYLTDLPVISSVTVGWVNRPFWYIRTLYMLVVLLLSPALGVVCLGWALDLLRLRVRTGRHWTPGEEAFGLLGLLMIGFAGLAMVGRADSIHVGIYAVPALLVGCILADRWRPRFLAAGGGLVAYLPHAFLGAWLVGGLAVQAQTMRAAPEKWLRLASPDARHLATPALVYLRTHGRPGDRLAGLPYVDGFGFYAFPLATTLGQPMPNYTTPAEFADFWREVDTRKPRWFVYQPLEPDARAHQSYFTRPLVGYRLVATEPSMLFTPDLPAYIYEREAAR